MNKDKESIEAALKDSGLYVSGVVVSSTAKAFTRKDGNGVSVKLRHEIAYQGGMMAIETFTDPKEDPSIKILGLDVVEFPRLAVFESVRFRIERFRVYNNQLIATSAQRVA